MLLKNHDEPIELWQLEALSRRLPSNHKVKERIERDVKIKRAGLRGEKEVDYPLRFLDKKKYNIIHDLRIKDQNGFFQIDTLILTPKYILILEVKNWYGTILFGENSQVTRISDSGHEEGFSNPPLQAKLQRFRLQRWLDLQGLSDLPVTFFVVISFPSTIIKSTPSHPIPKQVIHNNDLLFNIQALEQVYSVCKTDRIDIQLIGDRLIKAHTPSNLDVLTKYGIKSNELIRGVFCPQCHAVPLIRRNQSWYCQSCLLQSDNAHIPAFNDYYLLICTHISNRQARDFLRIDSPYVTKRLFQKAGFTHTGATKDRIYYLTMSME